MRKAFAFFTAILCAAFLAAPGVSFAAPPEYDGSKDVFAAMLVEAETGKVLYEQNTGERIYPASTTKLMTALLMMEHLGGRMDEEVTAGAEVNPYGEGTGSSVMGLRQNETVTIKDLLYGLMLSSGNEAAATIAVTIAGSEDAFAEMMNARAQELGMQNTHFVNACGIYMNQDDAGSIPEHRLGHNHYSTASDMAKLAAEVTKHPELMTAMGTKEYTVPPTNLHPEGDEPWTLKNTNLLIHTPETRPAYDRYLYSGATGMKTGLVNNIVVDGQSVSSYGCLVASAERDGVKLVALIFGDMSGRTDDPATPESWKRWDVAIDLFDYGFGSYAWADLSQYIRPVSMQEQVSAYADNDPMAGMLNIASAAAEESLGRRLIDKATADGLADGSIALETKTEMTKPMVAPISEGEEVGTVSYLLDGEEIASVKLLAERTVYELGNEERTRDEYGLPSAVPAYWWLWIVIPVGAVGALFLTRAINGGRNARRRGRTRYGRRPASPVNGRISHWKSDGTDDRAEKGGASGLDVTRTRRRL